MKAIASGLDFAMGKASTASEVLLILKAERAMRLWFTSQFAFLMAAALLGFGRVL
jgi:hypothetical protein